MSAQPGAGGSAGEGRPRDVPAAPGPLAVRASDDDRDQVVAILREQYSVGRLTLEEFEARTAAAYAATTWGDLAELLKDLPARPQFLAAHTAPRAPRPGPVATWAGPTAASPEINIVLLIVLLILFPPAGIIYLVVRLIQQSQSRPVITGGGGPGGGADTSRPLPPPGA